MRIGLYFGSFNPIHHGHLIIASHIANHGPVDQVWLVVSPQNPLKPAPGLLNEFHRLHLARLAIAADDMQLKVSDVEFGLPKPSYTIDTLTYLSEKYPQHQFAVIMGSDSFENIHKWKNHTLLMQQYPLLVYLRPDHSLPNHLPKGITVLKAPMLDISATYIRKLIQEKKSIRYLVPEPVRIEIEKAGYYVK
ncbi:MAG: nicotinate-nucleotide adenylyltransferase [Hydrotalea flava]|uniref:nicotinate (nicotinamide) nucleotide adenylyltransferase n=1 Tax=Hydrotalea TaxID=1004300 RepID=UPI0009449847|nr:MULTISPECIES: nicotinate (nicotinamide) nucleotide adenylyltransferase [Hydrotalea]MBY0348722.1 nicotinate-nucleotide adenylyltransferase [Hydrotalea flava]NIM35543.1 nicotinate-nucleotide adenylyltransferase [Hydrotalea flava]NIM38400.1 nicotinate-nucleotide adenylyltransferase [Hydrotalea flava]NIN03570.1 nicotinate-nucleotide adenylyltransferase [Hydrotalea flava]NIN15257.1 nicotinate-nucleotide adenylyltransferase [Hydrotalea flava]